ncbi:hypothetical protein [Caballeronia sp. M23-90]
MGRVIKRGVLNQEKLMEAILNAPTVQIGRLEWTITDTVDMRDQDLPFVFGKLVKYAENGHVTVVDSQSRSQVEAVARNLVEASSPFVYLPEYSGLAFLHVWNGIQDDVFPRRFKTIIESAYDKFFVGCDVEQITNYQEFANRLESIKTFTEIQAKVFPPNPMFGRLWKSLDSYVKRRQASDVSIKEVSANGNGLTTNVVQLIKNIIVNPQYEPDTEPDITDAALLMAADGYGSGRVVGSDGTTLVTIKTSDSNESFLYDKEPDAHRLAAISNTLFKKISTERNMRH